MKIAFDLQGAYNKALKDLEKAREAEVLLAMVCDWFSPDEMARVHPDISQWWAKVKAAEAKRNETLRASGIAKLTEDERKALGLKDNPAQ